MKVKSESEVPQSCLTLCDPMDCSLPGSSVPTVPTVKQYCGTNSTSVKQYQQYQLCILLPLPQSHGVFQARVLEWVAISFSRDLPDPGIEPGFPTLQADTLPSELPGKAHKNNRLYFIQSIHVGTFNFYKYFWNQKQYEVTLIIPIHDELKDFYWKKKCHPTT